MGGFVCGCCYPECPVPVLETRSPYGVEAWRRRETNPDGSLGDVLDGLYPEVYQIFSKRKTERSFNVDHETIANYGDPDEYIAVVKNAVGDLWTLEHYENPYDENTITYTGGGYAESREEIYYVWPPRYLRQLTIRTWVYAYGLYFTNEVTRTKYDHTGAVIDSSFSSGLVDIVGLGYGFSQSSDDTVTLTNTVYDIQGTIIDAASPAVTDTGTEALTQTLSEPYPDQYRVVIPHDFDPPPLPPGAPDPPLEAHDQRWHGTWHRIQLVETFTPEGYDPEDEGSPQPVETEREVIWTGPGQLIDYDGFAGLTPEQQEAREDSWKTDWVETGYPTGKGTITVEIKRSQCYHGAPWAYH